MGILVELRQIAMEIISGYNLGNTVRGVTDIRDQLYFNA